MDNKKNEKRFIQFFCKYISEEYRTHNNFSFEFAGDEAYKMQDKAIDKRIRKYLLKKYGIESDCWTHRSVEWSIDQQLPIGLEVRVKIIRGEIDEDISRWQKVW